MTRTISIALPERLAEPLVLEPELDLALPLEGGTLDTKKEPEA